MHSSFFISVLFALALAPSANAIVCSTYGSASCCKTYMTTTTTIIPQRTLLPEGQRGPELRRPKVAVAVPTPVVEIVGKVCRQALEILEQSGSPNTNAAPYFVDNYYCESDWDEEVSCCSLVDGQEICVMFENAPDMINGKPVKGS